MRRLKTARKRRETDKEDGGGWRRDGGKEGGKEEEEFVGYTQAITPWDYNTPDIISVSDIISVLSHLMTHLI